MSEEPVAKSTNTSGKTALLVATVYFLGGLVVAGYLSFINPDRTPIFFVNFLFWGVPFALFAIGFRREPRGGLGWVLIVLGWILIIVNLANCSSTLTLSGQTSRISEEIEQRANENRLDNEAALADAGWIEFPNADSLQADSGLEATREMLTTVRSIYEREQKQNSDLRRDWLNAIRSLDGPTHKIEVYASLVDGFYTDNEEKLRRIHEASMEVVLEAERLVDVLAKTPRSWVVENGQLLFDNDDDVDAYNQHLQRMQSLDAEIVQTQQSLQQ